MNKYKVLDKKPNPKTISENKSVVFYDEKETIAVKHNFWKELPKYDVSNDKDNATKLYNQIIQNRKISWFFNPIYLVLMLLIVYMTLAQPFVLLYAGSIDVFGLDNFKNLFIADVAFIILFFVIQVVERQIFTKGNTNKFVKQFEEVICKNELELPLATSSSREIAYNLVHKKIYGISNSMKLSNGIEGVGKLPKFILDLKSTGGLGKTAEETESIYGINRLVFALQKGFSRNINKHLGLAFNPIRKNCIFNKSAILIKDIIIDGNKIDNKYKLY